MKTLYMAIVLALSVILSACGMTGGSTKLQVKAKGKEATLNGKASYVSLSQVSPVSASFTIANYDPQKVEGTTAAFDSAKADGQTRVFFTIQGGQATDYQIKPGEYAVKAPNRTPAVRQAVVYYYEGGELYGERNESLSDTQGKVTITSVTDDAISGTIDIGDGEKFVKGDFTAKLLKK